MPISFPSKSHGRIPIGFFNIETDMLLMDRYFFFSTDFCEWVVEWVGAGDFCCDERMVYAIRQREMIGNLSSAIYATEFTGFIGEVYKLFPFPKNRSGFKQKPDGTKTRSAVEAAIQPFAVQLKIPIVFRQESRIIRFGDYVFRAEVFQEIISYIEAGGMPGWLNGRPPDYVTRMMAQIAISRHPVMSPIARRHRNATRNA
jgi:hypothetical protein